MWGGGCPPKKVTYFLKNHFFSNTHYPSELKNCWKFRKNLFIIATDTGSLLINEISKNMFFLDGRAAPPGGYSFSASKRTFIIPEFRKHFQTISWESIDNYYLLAFTENLKYSPKKLLFLFLRNYQQILKTKGSSLSHIPVNFLCGFEKKLLWFLNFTKNKKQKIYCKAILLAVHRQTPGGPPPVRKMWV